MLKPVLAVAGGQRMLTCCGRLRALFTPSRKCRNEPGANSVAHRRLLRFGSDLELSLGRRGLSPKMGAVDTPTFYRTHLVSIRDSQKGGRALSAFWPVWALQDDLDQRSQLRFPVAVPATVELGDEEHGARVLNLATGGAMIETSAPLLPRSALTLHCGTVTAPATVVWRKDDRIGVAFESPLTDVEVAEQVARSHAIALRRKGSR